MDNALNSVISKKGWEVSKDSLVSICRNCLIVTTKLTYEEAKEVKKNCMLNDCPVLAEKKSNIRVVTVEVTYCGDECPFHEGVYNTVCTHPETEGMHIKSLMVDDPFPEFCKLQRKEDRDGKNKR